MGTLRYECLMEIKTISLIRRMEEGQRKMGPSPRSRVGEKILERFHSPLRRLNRISNKCWTSMIQIESKRHSRKELTNSKTFFQMKKIGKLFMVFTQGQLIEI